MLISVFEDDYLKITSRQKQSNDNKNTILLSFTGIGHGMGGIDVQNPEFFGAGRSFDNIIFITDKTRSWGNQLDFKFIKETIAPYVGDRSIYSIGNSMGGFNSIISTSYMPTDVCVSFVPQYSVNPSIVPWERRWKKYTSKIKEYRFESVKNFINDKTRYFIFSGSMGADDRHAKLFPVKDNVHHYSFHNIAHDVAKELKEKGFLERSVQNCFNEESDLPRGIGYDKLSPKST
ncbi:hypothetical protein [Pacificibacter marinus]|uniref:Alpha/beta hydrolase family protein n=1 Tax=Pacificibacter marinus TaxID=658057 RepID=A0A1Y5T7F4_9RHOB|nr:hypothetical protein [Pacificibacter marinus]SEL20842.1 hypothetical protein SAMN04488032_1149 [Pacificibacter marinus]SLN55708.1 hypothetical protein PAM7971_02871 [Pacificibacter marinus]